MNDPNTWMDNYGLRCKEARTTKRKIIELVKKYGAFNLHSLDRHGAHTTIQQQFQRANYGVLPNATSSYKTDAARFLSHTDHLEAMHKAIDNFANRTGTVQSQQGYVVEFYMGRNISEGYLKNDNVKIQKLLQNLIKLVN